VAEQRHFREYLTCTIKIYVLAGDKKVKGEIIMEKIIMIFAAVRLVMLVITVAKALVIQDE
jgi:hypothetical protein